MIDAKIPPQNVQAEQSVLGAIMLDNTALDNVAQILKPENFYASKHQKIFSAMLEMSGKGDPVDTITLNNYLKGKGILENVGDSPYIAFLSSAIPTTANVMHYAKLVKEKSVLRKIISAATELSNEAFSESGDVDTFLDRAEQTIFEISQDKIAPSYYHIKEIIPASFKAIENIYKRKDLVQGVQSGFREIDKLTCGFQPSDLIIVAGRPSMGKTALALNIAQNAVKETNIAAAIFSLEMSKEQLITRMMCSEAEVSATRVRSGHLKDTEWPKLTRAAGFLSEANIFIDDSAAITALEIRSKCRRLKAEHNLGIIIVDYLQLMSGRGKQNSREQEISSISRALKALAKELKVPVVALSQLNRALEARPDKRPKLSDLRESGAIEQDADVIAFVYRDEVYNKNSKDRGIAEIIIGKQRNGPIGTVKLSFRKQYTKFNDLAEDQQGSEDYHDNY